MREQLTDFPGFQINIKDALPPSNGFRNPYDIERKDLLDQIIRMRANFLQPSSKYSKLIDDDTRHTLPIGQMGNYQVNSSVLSFFYTLLSCAFFYMLLMRSFYAHTFTTHLLTFIFHRFSDLPKNYLRSFLRSFNAPFTLQFDS